MNLNKRLIPVLLLDQKGLYKTTKFKKAKYVGDPINALKIFNEQGVDEIAILNFKKKSIDKDLLNYLSQIASEAFIPLSFGGGVRSVSEISQLFKIGFEKVIINSEIFNEQMISEAIQKFGSQSIVASIDIKKTIFKGYQHIVQGKNYELDSTIEYINHTGFGEVLVQDVSREGTMTGPDLSLISKLEKKFNSPMVFSGGFGNVSEIKTVLNNFNISAVAVGSLCVYFGKEKGVLINYPKL